jgi:hypothetical protein
MITDLKRQVQVGQDWETKYKKQVDEVLSMEEWLRVSELEKLELINYHEKT